jgi:hypothetical protein
MPAEGNGGAVGRPARKSRANAGARLRDILQQEAKDLKVSACLQEGCSGCMLGVLGSCQRAPL